MFLLLLLLLQTKFLWRIERSSIPFVKELPDLGFYLFGGSLVFQRWDSKFRVEEKVSDELEKGNNETKKSKPLEYLYTPRDVEGSTVEEVNYRIRVFYETNRVNPSP